MLTRIINGNVLTPSGWKKDCSVFVRDGKIVEISDTNLEVVGAEIFDAQGSYVVPGGIEIHAFLPHPLVVDYADDPRCGGYDREADGREG